MKILSVLESLAEAAVDQHALLSKCVTVKATPAEDETVDDSVDFIFQGREVMCLQVGRNYIAINSYEYDEAGELEAMMDHGMLALTTEAAQRAVAWVVKALEKDIKL